jgi:hypothetical protein
VAPAAPPPGSRQQADAARQQYDRSGLWHILGANQKSPDRIMRVKSSGIQAAGRVSRATGRGVPVVRIVERIGRVERLRVDIHLRETLHPGEVGIGIDVAKQTNEI